MRTQTRKVSAMKRYGLPLAAALAAALSTACGGKSADGAKAEGTPASITIGAADVATAARADVVSGVPVSGPLEPKVNMTVGAPMAEQIVETYVEEGQRVQQGQPLVRFKDEVVRAAANSARADVATQRMQVTIAVAESTRAEALLREGAIAPRDRDNALLGLNAARGRLALSESQLANAEDRLATSTLRAPATGVVSKRYLQAGDRVDIGKPVMDIVDTRVLQLTASVPVEYVGDLRVGRTVSLRAAQLDSTQLTGRISRINPTADEATRQVRIYVDIPNGAGRLMGGIFVSGRVLLRAAAGAVTVPRTALRLEGDARTPVVYVVAGGKVQRRVVGVGITDEEQGLVQITSGVQAGDVVVVGPVEGLAEGVPAEVLGRAPADTAAAAKR
jgi:membrane fusion protein (multidrug efflux system)